MHINRVILMGQVSDAIARSDAYSVFGLRVGEVKFPVYVFDPAIREWMERSLTPGALVQVDGCLAFDGEVQGGRQYVAVTADRACQVRLAEASVFSVAGRPSLSGGPDGAVPAHATARPEPSAATAPGRDASGDARTGSRADAPDRHPAGTMPEPHAQDAAPSEADRTATPPRADESDGASVAEPTPSPEPPTPAAPTTPATTPARPAASPTARPGRPRMGGSAGLPPPAPGPAAPQQQAHAAIETAAAGDAPAEDEDPIPF